jgi:hypothetical protein
MAFSNNVQGVVMEQEKKKTTVLNHRKELYITGQKIFCGEELSIEEREFIGRALCMIGEGYDPGTALLSKAGRGEKVGEEAKYTENRNRKIVAFIKTLRGAVNPQTEKKYTLEQAIAYVATDGGKGEDGENEFEVTANNILKIWNKYRDHYGFDEEFFLLP